MVDFIMRGWHDRSASPEVAWAIRFELYEAEREFRKARAGAIIRTITGWMRPKAQFAALPGSDGLTHVVPLDVIVGVLDEQGRRNAGIPILRRPMAEAWRRMYREPDHNAHLPLEVVGGADGWYLSGGTGALLVLEILRARGIRRIPVRTPALEEEDDRCGAA